MKTKASNDKGDGDEPNVHEESGPEGRPEKLVVAGAAEHHDCAISHEKSEG